MITQITLSLIRFYQKFLSFDTGLARYFAHGQAVCRHSPTCSQYTYIMVAKYGVFAGLSLGVKRIVSCGPFEKFQF